MVEETLVKEALSFEMIEAGEELLKRLDDANAEIVALYWFYTSDIAGWRLVVVSPRADTEGPIEVYKRIQAILSSSPELFHDLGLENISVPSPEHPYHKMLKSHMKIKQETSGIRVSNYVIGDEIVDAYIYRL